MPKLVRLYIRSVLIGFGVAGVFTAALLWLDVAGIGHLILASDIGGVAAAMLIFFNGIVFAAVQFGLSVMALAEDDDHGGGTGSRNPALMPIPVTVPAKTKGKAERR